MNISWDKIVIGSMVSFIGLMLFFFIRFQASSESLAVERPYEAAIMHDQLLQKSSLAASSGRVLNAAVFGEGDSLKLQITGVRPSQVAGTLNLIRPSDEKFDRDWPLDLDSSGSQHVSLRGFPQGRWLLKAEWKESGETYYSETSFFK